MGDTVDGLLYGVVGVSDTALGVVVDPTVKGDVENDVERLGGRGEGGKVPCGCPRVCAIKPGYKRLQMHPSHPTLPESLTGHELK